MPRRGYASDLQDRVQVRLPDGLRERLKADAKANNRSLNAEIVSRLLASVPPAPPPPILLSFDERLAAIERHLAAMRGVA